MCRKVMDRNAMVPAAPWVASGASTPGNGANRLSRVCAIVGSPTHPRPRLASVMPSCVPEIERSMERTARRASLAFVSPRRIIASMRLRRDETSANSAATKKAFARTSSATTPSRTAMDCQVRSFMSGVASYT